MVDLERCPMHYRRLPVTTRSTEDVEGSPEAGTLLTGGSFLVLTAIIHRY